MEITKREWQVMIDKCTDYQPIDGSHEEPYLKEDMLLAEINNLVKIKLCHK